MLGLLLAFEQPVDRGLHAGDVAGTGRRDGHRSGLVHVSCGVERSRQLQVEGHAALQPLRFRRERRRQCVPVHRAAGTREPRDQL